MVFLARTHSHRHRFVHAIAYIRDPASHPPGPVVALVGNERFLKGRAVSALAREVAGAEPVANSDDDTDDGEIEITRFTGKETDLATVLDELRMVSMWSDRKFVLIEAADDFVSKNRAGLESYLKNPTRNGVLALDVKSFPKNTKLAKAVAKTGLILECQNLSPGDLTRHLSAEAKTRYGKMLSRDAAALMTELAGDELGLLEQELAKLANYVGDQERITPEDVRTLVGGWRAETTWVMINALRDDRLSEALAALDQLLFSGEAPQKILGGISFVFRKFARATELAASGQNLNAALKNAGIFPRDVDASARYLRRLGRPRAERITAWLLETDGHLKGARTTSERFELERLMIRLAGKVSEGTGVGS